MTDNDRELAARRVALYDTAIRMLAEDSDTVAALQSEIARLRDSISRALDQTGRDPEPYGSFAPEVSNAIIILRAALTQPAPKQEAEHATEHVRAVLAQPAPKRSVPAPGHRPFSDLSKIDRPMTDEKGDAISFLDAPEQEAEHD